MRKALIVGIDFYSHINQLSGCVNDAIAVRTVLERHADASVNFPTPRTLTATNIKNAISRTELRDAIRDLFRDPSEIALFYFAGHGFIDDAGGFLCTSDSKTGDDGVSLQEIMTFAGVVGCQK